MVRVCVLVRNKIYKRRARITISYNNEDGNKFIQVGYNIFEIIYNMKIAKEIVKPTHPNCDKTWFRPKIVKTPSPSQFPYEKW